MSENKLIVSSSPHIRDKVTSGNIMLMVVIALLPASVFGVYNFGLIRADHADQHYSCAAVLTEYIYEKLMHKKITSQRLQCRRYRSSAGTEYAPHSAMVDGCDRRQCFAILVVKQLFGGLGQNFMNPALGARCFLLISFTGQMTTFVYDGVTGSDAPCLREGWSDGSGKHHEYADRNHPRNHRRDFCDRHHHRSDLPDPDGRH